MAHSQSPERQAPEQGKIWLILYSPEDNSDSLYLEIPMNIFPSLHRLPRKCLRYLGWCILGVEGRVAMDSPHSEDDIGDEGSFEDQGVYRYRYNTDGDPEGLPFSLVHCCLHHCSLTLH
jgi:hypothetical protein